MPENKDATYLPTYLPTVSTPVRDLNLPLELEGTIQDIARGGLSNDDLDTPEELAEAAVFLRQIEDGARAAQSRIGESLESGTSDQKPLPRYVYHPTVTAFGTAGLMQQDTATGATKEIRQDVRGCAPGKTAITQVVTAESGTYVFFNNSSVNPYVGKVVHVEGKDRIQFIYLGGEVWLFQTPTVLDAEGNLIGLAVEGGKVYAKGLLTQINTIAKIPLDGRETFYLDGSCRP